MPHRPLRPSSQPLASAPRRSARAVGRWSLLITLIGLGGLLTLCLRTHGEGLQVPARWQPASADHPALEPLRALPLLAAVLPVQAGGLEGVDAAGLLEQLRLADAGWTPRAEQLADGRIRYHYRRRGDEPPLTVAELRWRMANPPSFEQERRQISILLDSLARAGVRIRLEEPRKPGAAGEWDPRARSLRIRPRVVASGSADFAVVLNHEAIHVAQSCRSGGLQRRPQPLGLPQVLPAEHRTVLDQPVYRSATPLERQLEREAYANQQDLQLGGTLVQRYCRLATAVSSAPGRGDR